MSLTDSFYDPSVTLADEVYAAEGLVPRDDRQSDLPQ